MKGAISEIILTVGIFIAVGITLFLLRPLFFRQSGIAQDQPLLEFSSDIETTINRAMAATNDVSFIYTPALRKYVFTVSNNVVTIQDKITGKSLSFLEKGNQINNVRFEDAENICVEKKDQILYIRRHSADVKCGIK